MAADQASMSVNGSFAPGQPASYTMEQAAGLSNNDYSGAAAASQASNGNGQIPKDEVGWYFVEQYYTTLSKNPEKLYLYYSKQSQYVAGDETEKVTVCVGQKSINERIKSFGFQDCKVRVTNVDSQGSSQNIVIQVIGEMSNKSGPQRRFTQTFVLAAQPNGYYVLNDIFRYLVEEDEELPSDAPENYPVTADIQEADSHTLNSSSDPVERENQAALIDRELEEVAEEKAAPPALSQSTLQPGEATESLAMAEQSSDLVESVRDEDVALQDKPPSPEPTPAAASPKISAANPATNPVAPKPAVPKTWANLVAGGNRPPPQNSAQAPAAVSQTTTPPTQPKTTLNTAVQIPLSSETNSAAQDTDQSGTPQDSGSEWQPAPTRHDHTKSRSRAQNIPGNADNSRAYIKNIGENIDIASLRTCLSKFGELAYVDINRMKNCAFADFATPAGYQAAVAANPHELNGERFNVEERRVRPQSFGGAGFITRGGAVRGGRGGIPPANMQGRGGFQKDAGRGTGVASRGRGNPNGRGRGMPQAA